ncbi:hypothetical protein Dtox_1856 [Desulfofarcimen acetoxidans DSM 771]|uniref:Holin n=1 Tax=Desulfofarcimen acetoxidans (strain ATCC 49208 / DSM 771 / KCTC 5769 / VKM B-1644 / 5575) TaxID=485916 RepID=C8VXP7_DESAS|nr:hypothetical protein [Desulfofarcimen acetoxidans]ACV62703.1 hypothetical protein Dtox_1856 [Desulfofarcimen acetoxidans DSM 771]
MFEAGVVVAVIIALGQFVKGYLGAKYIPLVTMFLGIIGGYVYLPHQAIQDAVMNGVIMGLSSNGLFDMTKVIRK